MNNDKIKIQEYEAFDKIVNIKLFNDIVSFVMATTSLDISPILSKLNQNHIWFKRIKNNNIQGEYNFKYLGELLERYEQRIGNNIRDVRAIALGLAYAKDLVTKNMIVDTQLIDFITQIEELSKDDLYLQGALYVYDNIKYYNILMSDILEKLQSTEDVIFVMSVFDDVNSAFGMFQETLKKFLGKNKTIDVMENAGIYNWLIKTLYPIVKSNRQKDLKLFKALIKIPTGFINTGNETYNILVENGYTLEEIAFLNYILIFYQSIPDTVKIGKSIVEEKIAIHFCKSILNSENTYSDNVYQLIDTMLDDYRYFDIKVEGYEGLKQAIINFVNIKLPKVFIKFYKDFDLKIQSFDILDEKWNIVQQEFDVELYQYLFDEYLQLNDFTTEQIQERIKKYDTLTNSSYLDSFNQHKYMRERIYSKLVEKDIINLQEQFEKYRKCQKNTDTPENKAPLRYLKNYVEGIHTRKAFLFLKYFLNLEEYSIKDTFEFGFHLHSLFTTKYHYYGHTEKEFNIKRSFLSMSEHKELFMWLEDYVFYNNSANYMSFVVTMLKDDFIEKLFSKTELKQLYSMIITIDTELSKNKSLREKYLSKEELELLEKQEQEAKDRERLLEQQQLEQKVIEDFNSITGLNLKTIHKFLNKYWRNEETKMACKLVKEHFNNSLSTYNLSHEEIIDFNEVMNDLLYKNVINIEELKDFITKYLWKGEPVYAKNTGTYKINRKFKTSTNKFRLRKTI